MSTLFTSKFWIPPVRVAMLDKLCDGTVTELSKHIFHLMFTSRIAQNTIRTIHRNLLQWR